MGRLIAFLLDALVVFFIIRTVMRLFAAGGPIRRTNASPRVQERAGGTLVRDPHCGTYIPESRAIRVGAGEHALYFCSTKCRDAYRPS